MQACSFGWAVRPRDRGPADSSAPIDLLKALACFLIVLVGLRCDRTVLLAALAQADWPWARRLSRFSYSVFLTHFPICLIINAAWTAFLPSSPWLQLVGVLVAFKLSVLGGALFHAAVEAPAARWAAGLGWARPA